MPAFAILLALAVTSSSRPRPPLDGCDATPVEHGWRYECVDLRATIQDRPDAAETEIAGMLQAASIAAGDGARTRREKRVLDGSEVEVLVTEAPGNPRALFIVALHPDAGTRIVTCSGEDRRCASVLGVLAEARRTGGKARGSIRKDPAPLAIGGRPVRVPNGCESAPQPGGSQVVCANTDWVGWSSSSMPAAWHMRDDFGVHMRKTLARPGWKTTESKVPCRLAGAKTTCRRLLSESGSDAVLVLWAVAPLGEEYAFASCMMRGAKVGAPCSLVFDAVDTAKALPVEPP